MKRHRIVTISKNGSNPAYQGARIGMDRLAKLRGVDVQHLVPVVDDSIPEQAEMLERLLREPPDALLISCSHESQLDAGLEKLRDAGVVIVMFVGRTTRQELARCYVGSRDRAMTRAVAEAVARHLGGRGTMLVLDGNPLGILYEPRKNGFRDGLAAWPGVRVLGAADGHFLREPARAAMQSLLAQHGVPDAVLVANDFMGLGALDALREHGARPAMGSVNATPDGVARVGTGEMLVTAAFNAMGMGCLAMEAALRILRGETVPAEVLLPAELVTRENMAAWSLPYEERPLLDWDLTLANS
ncbi:MAG: xylitol-binding protein [Ramlibacter sp.]|jgi:ribose transport system substrate-binding protein|nr:xylitol-binding protein [Ramlibacter sp.]